MVSPPGDFQPDLPKVAYTPNRSVCHQIQQETTSVHVSSPGQGSLGSGRSEPIMVGPGWLCLPPDSKCYKPDSQP